MGSKTDSQSEGFHVIAAMGVGTSSSRVARVASKSRTMRKASRHLLLELEDTSESCEAITEVNVTRL